MIAQMVFTLVLAAAILVAFAQLPKIPQVGVAVICAALFGVYLVWRPDDATSLAHLVGIGRGADLLLYVWVLISFAILLLLYLNLRQQLQLITIMARKMALADGLKRPAEQRQVPSETLTVPLSATKPL